MVNSEEKYYPHNIAWIILNRLKDFNDKPEYIEALSKRFNRLTEHTLYFKFAPLYQEAVNYYEKHQKFPDLKYFNERFTDGRMIWEMTNASLSMDMYDELRKQLDYEIILQDFSVRLGHSDFIDIEGCKEFGKRLTKFAETNVEIPIDVKEDWINSYENFAQSYHGISTGIKLLDEQVGDLSGLVTVAAPSGNGKSTFVLSLAYNISTTTDENGFGRNVLYISFEMTKFQLQANLVSIESSFNEDMTQRLRATDIKEHKLDEHGRELYKTYMNDYMQRLNASKGYISLVDNTSMTGYTTIEEFMAKIEELSDKLGRKFDVIFIDNVDSLKMLEGERGESDMDKMNSFITKLDAFSKTYQDGYGTTIVLLSQVNRDGISKLKAAENKSKNSDDIDGTVLQKYSALYERATMVLVLYSSPILRSQGQLHVYPVKLRNKPLPKQYLILTTKWEYSYVVKTARNNPPQINEIQTQEDDDDLSDIKLDWRD